jgi:diguanylate cyclase (GGDEF)-like protein
MVSVLADNAAERERLLNAVLAASGYVLGAADTEESVLRLADALVQASPRIRGVWYGVGAMGAMAVEPRQVIGPDQRLLEGFWLQRHALRPRGPLFEVAQAALSVGPSVRAAWALPVEFREGRWRGWIIVFSDDPAWLESVGPTPFRALARFAEVAAEQARLRLQLETAAMRDPLSGLLNRRAMLERILAALERARGESKGELSIALFDIDHFKRINDTHGHDVGDIAIRAVAGALRDGVRDADTVARWGGEEFLVLFDDTSPGGSLFVANRLRLAVEALQINAPGHRLRISCSGGVAAFGLDGSDEDSLLRIADERLYAAKQAGRNRVVGGEGPAWVIPTVPAGQDPRRACGPEAAAITVPPVQDARRRSVSA